MPLPLTLARGIGAGRTVIGLALVVAPDLVTARWVGPTGATPAGRALARGLGARDLVLGVGAALAPPNGLRGWVLAGVAADTVDLVATGTSSGLPTGGRVGTAALAGGAVAAGIWVLTALD